MTVLAILAVALMLTMFIAALFTFFDGFWEPVAVVGSILGILTFGLWGVMYLFGATP
jgi:hypothetical protein